MAEFIKAHKETLKIEGGYANDPVDNGGETWKGIARKFHSSWLGWRIIDKVKKENPGATANQLNRLLMPEKDLERLELAFYKVEFWDMIKGDQINDQATASMIYDNAINIGITPAIRMAQQVAFGVENEAQAKALEVTFGRMDTTTLNKLNNVA
jgi:lysozyme family protein